LLPLFAKAVPGGGLLLEGALVPIPKRRVSWVRMRVFTHATRLSPVVHDHSSLLHYRFVGNFTHSFVIFPLSSAFSGMFGLSKLMFPILGQVVFHQTASTILMFIVAFGATKGLCSAIIGVAADECGRCNILRVGWMFGIPVFPLIMTATTWTQVIIANTLLGVHQGITWTVSILMMLDLTDHADRATMIGSNEFLGFFMVALVTLLSSINKTKSSAMKDFDVAFWGGLAMTLAGTFISIILPETRNADHTWIIDAHDEEFGDEVVDELEAEAAKMDPHEIAREKHLWHVNQAHLERNTRALIDEARVRPSDVLSPRNTPATPSRVPTTELKLSVDPDPNMSSASSRLQGSELASPEVRSDSAYGLEALSPVTPVDKMYEVSNPEVDDPVAHEPPNISIWNPASPPPLANFTYVFKLLYDTAVAIWEVSTTSFHIASALFAGWATGAKEGAIWGLSPLFFKSFNFSMEQIGILLGVYFFILSTSKMFVGYFADRGAGKMLVLGGLFLEIFALLYWAWAPELTLIETPQHHAYPLFVVGSIVMGVGHAAIVPTLQHAMIQHVPKARQGAVLGVFRMWLGFGLCAGAGLGGYLADLVNFSFSFSIMASIMGLAIVVIIVVMIDIPSHHSATAKLSSRFKRTRSRRRATTLAMSLENEATPQSSPSRKSQVPQPSDDDHALAVTQSSSATSQRTVLLVTDDAEPDIFPASTERDDDLMSLLDEDSISGDGRQRNMF